MAVNSFLELRWPFPLSVDHQDGVCPKDRERIAVSGHEEGLGHPNNYSTEVYISHRGDFNPILHNGPSLSTSSFLFQRVILTTGRMNKVPASLI